MVLQTTFELTEESEDGGDEAAAAEDGVDEDAPPITPEDAVPASARQKRKQAAAAAASGESGATGAADFSPGDGAQPAGKKKRGKKAAAPEYAVPTEPKSIAGTTRWCPFLQHMPRKPIKLGIKAFVLADSVWNYMFRWRIYTGSSGSDGHGYCWFP